MTSTPRKVGVAVPNNCLEVSGDAYSAKAALQGRHWLEERFAIVAAGPVLSGIPVANDQRAVITAWGVDWGVGLAFPAGLSLEIVLAGNAYLGSPDSAPGVFTRQGQMFQAQAGTLAGGVANLLPDGAQLVTSPGSAGAPLWRISAGLTPPDAFDAVVWYHLISAETAACTAAP